MSEDLQIVSNGCYEFKILAKEKELNLFLVLMCPANKDSQV
jgi:hypothetical protein